MQKQHHQSVAEHQQQLQRLSDSLVERSGRRKIARKRLQDQSTRLFELDQK